MTGPSHFTAMPMVVSPLFLIFFCLPSSNKVTPAATREKGMPATRVFVIDDEIQRQVFLRQCIAAVAVSGSVTLELCVFPEEKKTQMMIQIRCRNLPFETRDKHPFYFSLFFLTRAGLQGSSGGALCCYLPVAPPYCRHRPPRRRRAFCRTPELGHFFRTD